MFEIGNSLREARLRRGVEFAQVEQVTKIRVKYLQALEDEQFDVLPSEIYVKGFLRTYAEYLGLDGQLYVDEFNSAAAAGEEFELRQRRATAAKRLQRNRRLETTIVLFVLALVAVVTIVDQRLSLSAKNGGAPRSRADRSRGTRPRRRRRCRSARSPAPRSS